LTKKIAQNN